MHERKIMGSELCGNKEPSFSIIAERVAERVEQLYKDAAISTLSKHRLTDKIHAYHKKYVAIKAVLKRVQHSEKTNDQVNKFKENALELFPIVSCKYVDFDSCSCSKEKEVPFEEGTFLADLRSDRLMPIDALIFMKQRGFEEDPK